MVLKGSSAGPIIRQNARVKAVSAANSADAEIGGLIVGTSDHQGTAANSLVLSNIDDDGDIQMLVNDGGHSKEFLLANGDTADLQLGHGMATATIKTASGDLTLSPGGSLSLNAATGGAIRLNDAQADVDVVWESDGADNQFHLNATTGNAGFGGTAAVGPQVRIYAKTSMAGGHNGAVFLDNSNSDSTQIQDNTPSLPGFDFKTFEITGDTGTRTVDDAATLSINGPPTAGGNAAITRPWSLWVESGNSRFEGNVDLNSTGEFLNVGASGNTWGANLLALANPNSGAGNMIKVGNTSTDANSSAVVYIVSDGTSAGDAYTRARAGTHESVWGLDNSGDNGAIGNNAALGANDALRFTNASPPVITFHTGQGSDFDYVCDTCGESSGEPFECHGIQAPWHDDVAALQKVADWAKEPQDTESLRHLEKLGIFDLKQNGNEITPWVGMSMVNAQLFTWAGMRQMYRKIEGLESELKALKAA
mgnify:CR=1 FL=1